MNFTLFRAFIVVQKRRENHTGNYLTVSRRVVLKCTKIAESDFIKLLLYIPVKIKSRGNILRIKNTIQKHFHLF
jgi:hypothetical protein